MEAAAFSLACRVKGGGRDPDVIVASDYVDVPRLRGFLPPHLRAVPVLLYLHENQLTYPNQDSGTDRNHYGFTNILSCLSADAIAFNSHFHKEDFGEAARDLLQTLPRPVPRAEFDSALEKAQVIYPGIDLSSLPLGTGPPASAPLRVVCNHRWEYDKDPVGFLAAVLAARATGAEIEVVMLGDTFASVPVGMQERLDQLGSALLWSGFVEDRAEYARTLGECDLVVSSARHEFYGMAVLEGLGCGCSALAPARLAYPEHLPSACLYGTEANLRDRLVEAAAPPDRWRDPGLRARCRELVREHGAQHTARMLDEVCGALTSR